MRLGSKIPEFSLLNQDREKISSEKLIGQPLVIFFYPRDDSPMCTIEACTFRDHFSDFKSLNAKVIGISTDSPESHASFVSKHQLNFDLLSDSNKSVERRFGLSRSLFGLLGERVTFIFDSNGTLIRKFESQLQGKKHVEEALKSLR